MRTVMENFQSSIRCRVIHLGKMIEASIPRSRKTFFTLVPFTGNRELREQAMIISIFFFDPFFRLLQQELDLLQRGLQQTEAFFPEILNILNICAFIDGRVIIHYSGIDMISPDRLALFRRCGFLVSVRIVFDQIVRHICRILHDEHINFMPIKKNCSNLNTGTCLTSKCGTS